MSARIPFGYRIRNGKAEPDPVEASQLQQFFRLYLQGKPASVASREAGIPRTSACCRKMLSNPVYCGTDYYPRLISPAQTLFSPPCSDAILFFCFTFRTG